MSTEVDNRVVQMQFDNKQFESGVQETLKSLNRLNESLKMQDSAKGFESLNQAANRVNLNGIGDAVESVRIKFSFMQAAAFSALDNIVTRAMSAGERIIKSLSIDQITSGYSKYDSKTGSIQTLVNSTGKSAEEIGKILDKVLWYSDETSYSMDQMINSISTMVSNGGDLEKAVSMSIGIANATAFAGKGAAEFSQTIRNITQSYSSGYLQYRDWFSLQTAGTNSKQLMETLIQVGEEMGKIEKGAVTVSNFTSTLSTKWADTAVMEEAFARYSKLAEDVYTEVNKEGSAYNTASEAIADMADKYDYLAVRSFKAAQEAKTFTEAISATKDAVSSTWSTTFETIFGNYEQATKLWTFLANELYDIFVEPRNEFNEMLEEWNSPENNGRAKLLEGLAYGYQNLKNIFSAIKEVLREIFPKMTSDKLISFTEKFTEFMKQTMLSEKSITRIKDGFKGIFSVLKLISDAISKIVTTVMPFLGKGGGGLLGIILNIFSIIGRALTYLTELVRGNEKLSNALTTVASALKTIAIVIFAVVIVAFGALGKLISGIIENFSSVTEVIDKAWASIKTFITGMFSNGAYVASGFWNGFISTFTKVLKNIIKAFKTLIIKVEEVFNINSPSKVFFWIGSMIVAGLALAFSSIPELGTESGNKLVQFFSNALYKLRDVFALIGNSVKVVLNLLGPAVTGLGNVIKNITGYFKELIGDIGDRLKTLFTTPNEDGLTFVDRIKNATEAIRTFLANVPYAQILVIGLTIAIIGAIMNITKLMESTAALLKGAATTLNSFASMLGRVFVQSKRKTAGIVDVAISIAVLSASIAGLAILQKKIGGLWEMLGFISALLTVLTVFGAITKKISDGAKAIAKLAIATAALNASSLIIVLALERLQNVNFEGLLGKIGGLIVMMTSFAMIAALITKFTNESRGAIKTALIMLGLSVSIKKLCDALVSIGTIDINKMKASVAALTFLMVGMGVMTAGFGQIKLGSFLAAFLIVKLLQKYIPIIVDLAKTMPDTAMTRFLVESLTGIIEGLAVSLAIAITVFGLLGPRIKAATRGIAGCVAAVSGLLVVVSLCSLITKYNLSAVGQTFAMALTLLGSLALIIHFLTELNKSATDKIDLVATVKGLRKMITAVSGLLISMVLVSKFVKANNWNDLKPLITTMAVTEALIWSMYGLVAATATLAKGEGTFTMKTAIAIITSVAVLFAELALLSIIPTEKLAGTAAAMSFVMLSLMTFVYSASALANALSKKGNLVKSLVMLMSIAALIGGAAYAIAKLSSYENDFMGASKALSLFALTLSVGLIPVARAMSVISAMDWSSLGKGLAGILVSLLAMSVPMLAFGKSMQLLAGYDWENIRKNMWTMMSALGVMLLIVGALGAVAVMTGGIGLAAIAAGLIGVAAAIGVFAIGGLSLAKSSTELANSFVYLRSSIETLLSEALISAPLDSAKAAYNFVKGFYDGVIENKELAVKAVTEMGLDVIDALYLALDEHSPSVKAYAAGAFVGVGLGNGIAATVPYVKAETQNMASEGVIEPLVDGGNAAIEVADQTGEGIFAKFKTWFEKIKTLFSDFFSSASKNGLTGAVAEVTGKIVGEKFLDIKGTFGGAIEDAKGILAELGLQENENAAISSIYSDTIDDLSESFGGLSDAAGGAKSTMETLEDTISGQMDLFSEFNRKTEITAEDMLNNMHSNIIGISEWANNMATLAARGMSEGLLKQLGDLGPSGYEKVAAFVSMTDDQLQQANNLYASSLLLPKGAATEVEASYTYAGELAGQGYSDALNAYAAVVGDGRLVTSTVAGIVAASASPSTKTGIKSAANTMANDLADEIVSTENINKVSNSVNKLMSTAFSRGNVSSVIAGNGLDTALRAQLSKSSSGSRLVQQYGSDLGTLYLAGIRQGLVDKSLSNRIESAVYGTTGMVVNATKTGWDIHSPSRIAEGLAQYWNAGLIKGFKDDQQEVVDSSTSITDKIREAATNAFDYIMKAINGELSLNPVITPVLDLSEIQNGVSSLNSIMGNGNVAMAMNGYNANMARSQEQSQLAMQNAIDRIGSKCTDAIVSAIRTSDKPVSVNLTLQGDAAGIFKLVRAENSKFTRVNGYNALA